MAATEHSGRPASLLLPRVTSQQALLLLKMLYAPPDLTAWASAQSIQDLEQLAQACSALACKQLLALIDRSMAKQARSYITAANALHACTTAYQCELTELLELCTQHMVQLLPQIALPAISADEPVHQLLVPVLKAAQLQQATSVQERQAVQGHVQQLEGEMHARWENADAVKLRHSRDLQRISEDLHKCIEVCIKETYWSWANMYSKAALSSLDELRKDFYRGNSDGFRYWDYF